MQNVVIFAPWFGVNSGGAEIALLKIGESLRDLGCNVEFYTSRSLRPYEDWLQNPPAKEAEEYKGFTVRRFAVDEAGFDRFQLASQAMASGRPLQQGVMDDFFKYGLTSSALVNALKALPEETIIIGGPYYQAMVHNAVAALPGRITIMPAFHEEAPFHFPAVNRLVRDARSIMFLTEVEKTLTIESHGDAMNRAKFETPVLSLPFVNEERPQPSSERGLFGGLFDKYMLYVGRIDEGKNVRALMTWHHEMNETRLKQNKKTIPLLMVGKGVETGFVSPHVKQLGYLSEDDKRKVLADALGLVNLSLNESFSFVLFEAWQLKIPVIVHSGCKVMNAHIEKGKGGYSSSNPPEYSSAVEHFENHQLQKILGENGQNYAEEICGKEGFLQRLSQILEVGHEADY
jgi:glycosyltransferase involved in cell wall biosynthesis